MATKKPFPKGLFGGKETYGEELKEAKAIKSGKLTPKQYAMGEKSEGVHKMKKMASGGMTSALAKHAAKPASKAHAGLKAGGSVDGIAQRGKTRGDVLT
jgi:hypothetical protein